MNKRRLVYAAVLCTACTRTPVVERPPVVAFADLMSGVENVSLNAGRDSTVLSPVGTLVTNDHIVVLDRGRADLRVFNRSSGAVERLVSDAGDGAGQLRKPSALAALDSGRFVVLDAGRKLLSFRDSLGAVLREVPLPDGTFTSMVALPAERRILLAGKVLGVSDAAAKSDVHEFDLHGRLLASYGEKAKTRSTWETAFNTVYVAGAGANVLTGTLGSNVVRIIDRGSKTVRFASAGAGWYAPLEYPSDNLLQRGATQQGAAKIVTAWTRSHRLMNGLFALSGGRVLARFQAFSPSGDRFFYYTISDTTGRQLAVTRPTRAQVLSTNGDTLFWIAGAGRRPVSFGSGVMMSPTHAQIAWAVSPHDTTHSFREKLQ